MIKKIFVSMGLMLLLNQPAHAGVLNTVKHLVMLPVEIVKAVVMIPVVVAGAVWFDWAWKEDQAKGNF